MSLRSTVVGLGPETVPLAAASSAHPARAETVRDGEHFDAALAGRCRQLVRADGGITPLAPDRWADNADEDDCWILDRCRDRTLDLGCGPGRLVVALAARCVPVLGVDVSAHAIARCGERGANVLHRNALGPLPQEGRWTHVILADGNIGIGGDPEALLRRCQALLCDGGSIIVELEPDVGFWQGLAHLVDPSAPVGPDGAAVSESRSWFPWAVVGPDAVDELATGSGLVVVDRLRPPDGGRCFAELSSLPSSTTR